MKEEKSEETFFNELMSKSKLEFPFPDFEDNVMRIVELNQKKQNIIQKDLRLSWIFFLLGSSFGITISILLPKFQEPIFGLSVDKFTIPFQVLFIFLFITQLNYLMDYYSKTKITKR
jgi:hypothetical protein